MTCQQIAGFSSRYNSLTFAAVARSKACSTFNSHITPRRVLAGIRFLRFANVGSQNTEGDEFGVDPAFPLVHILQVCECVCLCTGDRTKVRELESKRISDFRPCLHIGFIRLQQHTGDTSANCRIFEPLRFSYFRAAAVDVLQYYI